MAKTICDVVVIGGNHYNTLWVVRSLGKAGYHPYVIVENPNANHSFVTHSIYATEATIVNDCNAMIAVLKDLEFSGKVPLFSSSDTLSDSIDRNYDALENKYFLPNCGKSQSGISAWMDKSKMNKTAKECGFTVPYSLEIDLEQSFPNLSNVPLPCILKPLKSSEGTKADFRICYTYELLLNDLKDLSSHCRFVLLQEYIKPDFEISILAMRHRGSKIHIVPGLLHKIGTCKSTHNLGMPTYAFVEEDLTPYVDINVVNRFLNLLDYEGLYSIEFFVANRKAYFLEINLRVDGDLFVYTTAGCNMPAIWADLCFLKSVTEQQKRIIMKRTYGMTEISYMKYLPSHNPLKIIQDWWKTDCYSIFSWSDPLPFIFKFIYH